MKKVYCFILTLASVAQSATIRLSESRGTVSFRALGNPGFLSIDGKAQGPVGTLKAIDGKLGGELLFNLEGLHTGVDLRDEHMKAKYLEVQKHPEAKFTLNELVLPKSGEEFAFSGKLSLHGQQQDLKGTATVGESSGSKQLEAKFSIALSNFGIATPRFTGITVGEEVLVDVRADLESKE